MEVDISTEMPAERTPSMNPEIFTARDWRRANPLYLDTETTGLDAHAQVVEVTVMDDAGALLLDTFVKPTVAIPPVATAIHGITDAQVASAPAFPAVWAQLKPLLVGRTVIIYNAQYDVRLLRQSAVMHDLSITAELEAGIGWQCAMQLYADFHGEWDEHHGNNKWQNLGAACQQMHIAKNDVRAHRAAGDCELTRRLIHALAILKPYELPKVLA
jgi:DNA polymerase-3 subunit epsilon